jgi:putative protein kinase ArgK-like GTPase of G3E family
MYHTERDAIARAITIIEGTNTTTKTALDVFG